MPPKVIITDKPFTIFSTEADKDYVLARAMNIAGNAFHGRAGYAAHQACEKYLKAFMLQASGKYSEGHILSDLRSICATHDKFFDDAVIVETVRIFDEFEQVGRYGAAANFDPKSETTTTHKTMGVMMWSASYIQRLDHFVFETRGRLDFKKANYGDSFHAMLNGDKKKLLTEWNLRPPLSVILTRDNKYFRRSFNIGK